MRNLRYPDFTVPASLVILGGVSFAALNLVLKQNNAFSWAISVYLIVTGIFLARRSWLGTGLLIVGACGLLVNKIARFFEHGMDCTFFSVVRDLLGLVILAGLVAHVIGQVRYFKDRARKASHDGSA